MCTYTHACTHTPPPHLLQQQQQCGQRCNILHSHTHTHTHTQTHCFSPCLPGIPHDPPGSPPPPPSLLISSTRCTSFQLTASQRCTQRGRPPTPTAQPANTPAIPYPPTTHHHPIHHRQKDAPTTEHVIQLITGQAGPGRERAVIGEGVVKRGW